MEFVRQVILRLKSNKDISIRTDSAKTSDSVITIEKENNESEESKANHLETKDAIQITDYNREQVQVVSMNEVNCSRNTLVSSNSDINQTSNVEKDFKPLQSIKGLTKEEQFAKINDINKTDIKDTNTDQATKDKLDNKGSTEKISKAFEVIKDFADEETSYIKNTNSNNEIKIDDSTTTNIDTDLLNETINTSLRRDNLSRVVKNVNDDTKEMDKLEVLGNVNKHSIKDDKEINARGELSNDNICKVLSENLEDVDDELLSSPSVKCIITKTTPTKDNDVINISNTTYTESNEASADNNSSLIEDIKLAKSDDSKSENIDSENSAENLISNCSPKEWLNIDEFENIITDLNSVSSSDICDFEETIEKYVVDKKINDKVTSTRPKDTDTNVFVDRVLDKTKNDAKMIIDNSTVDNEVICISSDEENELELSISLDDLETISLSSIEGLCDDKITTNISEFNSKLPVTDSKNCSSVNTNNKRESISIKEDTVSKDLTTVKIIIKKSKDNNISHQTKAKIDNNKFSLNGVESRVFNNNETSLNIHSNRASLPNEEEKVSILNSPDEKVKTTKIVRDDEIDKISLTSNDLNNNIVESICSDYDSSDFEFITEEDAKKDGLIINYFKNSEKHFEKDSCTTIEVLTDSGFNCSNSSQPSGSLNLNDMPGPSRQNVTSRIPRNDIGRSLEGPVVDYRENHAIPEGNEYYNLFQGYNAPAEPYMYENKSMSLLRNVQYEGLGFDMRLMRRELRVRDAGEEYKKEADESIKKILNMYPGANRKRRRRF